MNKLRIATLIVGLLALSGCTALFDYASGGGTRQGVSSSLVDYLYPDGDVPPQHTESIPHLNLPLRVGLAFVPAQYTYNDISEATKMELLDGVRQTFVEHDYVEHIEIIPDTYLRSTKGIDGMQQVARLYGVDVMALVSYDQVVHTEDNKAAILYWTIVGAYFIDGTDNNVQTFVDTAVLDVPTAKLLFRAPGIDRSTERATAIEAGTVSREHSEVSFATAVDQMTGNLGSELVRFEERVAENPQLAEVSWKEGHGGTGSFEGLFLMLLVVFAIVGIARSVPDTDRRQSPLALPRAVSGGRRPKRPSIDKERPTHP